MNLKLFAIILFIIKFVDSYESNTKSADESNLYHKEEAYGHISYDENLNEKQLNSKEKSSKPLFDARFDTLPKNCQTSKLPSNCAEATECTKTSGYYYLAVSQYRETQFLTFCDFNDDWLYILRRVDGSENFKRNWIDYVNGFGKAEGEFWIGLENLYALTRFNGPQELYVHIENFKGETAYAQYDSFAVGNVNDNYTLKSLGEYSGTAGDSLSYHLGSQFSTYDVDNDERPNASCAQLVHGGFWYKNCVKANPTGKYLRGAYTSPTGWAEGVMWFSFGGNLYSHKTMTFMIRRQRDIPSREQICTHLCSYLIENTCPST